MSKLGLIKNIAIVLDFFVSIVASSIKNSMPEISNTLFCASAVLLIVAVVCVIVELINLKLKR